MSKKLPVAALAALGVIGLAWLFWPRDPAPLPPPAAPAVVTPPPVAARPAAVPLEVPAGEDRAPAENAGSARDAHARIGEALGLYTLRCHVGSDFDGDRYVGEFRHRIEDGWFSTVVRDPAGVMPIEEHVGTEKKPDWKKRFLVRWQDAVPGAVSPCTAEALRYGDVVVVVEDPDHQRVPDARVHTTCGGSGTTDAQGTVTLLVITNAANDDGCMVKAFAMLDPERSTVQAERIVHGLRENHRREVLLTVQTSESEPMSATDRLEIAESRLKELRVLVEELTALRDVASPGTGHDLLEFLVENRGELMEFQEQAVQSAETSVDYQSGAITTAEMMENMKEDMRLMQERMKKMGIDVEPIDLEALDDLDIPDARMNADGQLEPVDRPDPAQE